MSKNQSKTREDVNLSEVKVDVVKQKQRRNTHTAVVFETSTKRLPKVSSRSNDFVYTNNAYVGSLNSVNEIRTQAPTTGVYREQYWTCSKWSVAKRVLAVGAGVLLGAFIGLSLTLALKGDKTEDVIGGIFWSSEKK